MKNNRIPKIIMSFCLISISVMAWSADDTTRRLGIFVGSNNGGNNRTLLRYAVSDARTVSRVFAEMGGVKGSDNVLLIEPSIQELGNAVDRVQELLQTAKQTAKRTELVFYYSGHSDETGLLLGKERYSYQKLRERINQIPSDMRIVILDSCASGAFTRTKGGTKTQPFLIDTAVSVEGYAFLTSSSATESSQESDRIESSYFTHNLVAGLRGAADTVGDGQVTLNEVYRFAYTETLLLTETSLYGAQHPSYDMQVSGSGDVVLTDVRENSASLLIDASLSGRLSIRDMNHLIAEITKVAGKPIELGLETGPYQIILQQGDNFYRANLFLAPNTQTRLSMRDFALIAASPAIARGPTFENDADDADEPVAYEPVSFQWVSSLPNPQRVTNNLLLGVINAGNYSLNGLGIASIGLLSSNDVFGWQTALGYTVAGNDMNGVQIAGLINVVGDSMTGIQAVGLVNVAGHSMTGIQFAGAVNIAGHSMTGIQFAGLIDAVGESMTGIQSAGLINAVGRTMTGIQSAALFSITGGTMYGLQVSGLGNVNGESATGLHVAGLFNVSGGNNYGVQAAGIFNFAGNIDETTNQKSIIRSTLLKIPLFKWQLAGIFNVAGNDFYGIQIAPLNISGRNKQNGLSIQVGGLNISSNEWVLPIGIINIVRNGIFNPAVYYDKYEMLNFSFRSGSRYFYSLFSVATTQADIEQLNIGKDDAGDLFALRAGFGVEFSGGNLFLDLDITAGVLIDMNNEDFDINNTKLIEERLTNTIQGRVTLGLMLFEHFSIFVGISYDYFNLTQSLSPMPKYSWDYELPASWSNENNIHKLGFFWGIQL